MKKLLTLALAAVTAVSAFGQKVDVFTSATATTTEGTLIQGSNWSDFSVKDYSGSTTNMPYHITAGAIGMGGFAIGYNTKGYISNTANSEGLVLDYVNASIASVIMGSTPYEVHASNEPFDDVSKITADNKVGVLDGSNKCTISGDYKYVAIWNSSTSSKGYFVGKLEISWKEAGGGGEVTKPQAEKPEFKNLTEPLKVGDSFQIESATTGAKISYRYIICDNETAPTGNYFSEAVVYDNPYTVTVPATAEGMWLHIIATATSDETTESDALTGSYYIATEVPENLEALNYDWFTQASIIEATGQSYSYNKDFETSALTGTYSKANYSGTIYYTGDEKFGVGRNGSTRLLATTTNNGKLWVDYVKAVGESYNSGLNGNKVYVSNQPITLANYENAHYAGLLQDQGNVAVTGDYKYVAIVCEGASWPLTWSELQIGWKGVKPAELDPAAKPVITAPAEVKVGEEFTFSTTSEGATTWYQVAVEDAETDTPDYAAEVEGASYTVKEEEAGKVLYFSVVAKGDNYKDSEATVEHFNVAKAEEPAFEGATGEINVANLKAANETIDATASGINNTTKINASLKYADDAAEYELANVLAHSDNDAEWCWWAIVDNGDAKGFVRNVTAPAKGHIEKITVTPYAYGGASVSGNVYVSNEKIDAANLDAATAVAFAKDGNNYTATIEGSYKYMYFNLVGSSSKNQLINNMTIVWVADAEAQPVAGINFDNLKNHAENSEKDFSSEWNEDGTRNVNDMLIHEQDGIRYELHNVVAGASATEGVSGWWSLENGGYLRTAENADNTNRIVSIEYTGVGTSGIADLNVYVSNEQLTPENVADKGVKVSFAVAESGPAAAPAAQADNTLGNPVKWDAGNADYKHLYIEENGRDVAVRNLNVAWGIPTGIEAIDAENANAEVYNLNGYRVNPENLAPGVYVRKVNGKTSKFIVK